MSVTLPAWWITVTLLGDVSIGECGRRRVEFRPTGATVRRRSRHRVGGVEPSQDRLNLVRAPIGHPYAAHNIFLEVVGELGFVALFGMVGFLLCALWSGWRARNGELGGEARAIFAALVGYLVCQLFSGYSLSWFLYALCAFAACCDIWAPKPAARDAALSATDAAPPHGGLGFAG